MNKSIRFRPIYVAALVFLLCLVFIIEAIASEHLEYVLDFVGFGGTFRQHDLTILGLPAYWFMMILGLCLCIYVSFIQRKQYRFSKVEALLIPLVFLTVSLIGGKLMYIVENYKAVMQNGISFEGLSLFGAVFLIPIVIFLIARFTKKNFAHLLDFCTPFGLILLACVRSGCFINGCCGAITIWDGSKPIILPVQLIEVTLDLLILEACRYIEKKRFGSGLMYPLFLMCYGVCRFFLEFLRSSGAHSTFFSGGHFWAIISLVSGTVLFVWFQKRNA